MLSNVYLGVFLAVPVAVLLLVAFARRRPALTWRRAGGLAVAGAALLATNAPALRQYAQVQEELGFAHSIDEVRRYSARVRSYASVWHERETTWLWHEESSDRALFPGALLTVLAGVGVAVMAWRRGRPSRDGHEPGAYLLMAVVVFAITLGPEPAISTTPIGIGSPYALMMDAVPGFDGFAGALGDVRDPGPRRPGGCGRGGGAGRPQPGRAVRRAGCRGSVLALGRPPQLRLAGVPARRGPVGRGRVRMAGCPAQGRRARIAGREPFSGTAPVCGSSVTLRYQLAALKHGQTLVNGSSGFVTPFVSLLQGHASPLTTLDTADDALRILRAIGAPLRRGPPARLIPEVHAHDDGMQAAMRADRAQVEDVRDFGSTVVLALRPAPAAMAAEPAPRLTSDLFDVTASHNGAAVPGSTDGDIATHGPRPSTDGPGWRFKCGGRAW